MQLPLVWMMIVFCHTGSSEELVTPFREVMMAVDGENVTLSCNYSGSVTNLYWYQQKSGSSPQLLIGGYSEKTEKLSTKHDTQSNEFHLEISSAALTDSAVYYCALRPATGSGNFKLTFGEGTKVTVETRDKYEPSYHKLQGNDLAACLATGFTRINEVNETLFSGTEAVRISGESVYTQVAVLTTEDKKQKCDELEAGSGDCGDPLNRDPMVNLMSLTVVGLRLIFIKTIIFNVLMTFKLWMSQ